MPLFERKYTILKQYIISKSTINRCVCLIIIIIKIQPIYVLYAIITENYYLKLFTLQTINK